MTQVTICVSRDGAIVCSDTNCITRCAGEVRTGLFKKTVLQWPSGFVSSESKVCLSKSGIAVAITGCVGTRQDAMQIRVESLVNDSESSFDDLKKAVVDFVEQEFPDIKEETNLVFIGYDGPENNRKLRVERTSLDTGMTVIQDTNCPAIILEGNRDVACRLLDPWVKVLRDGRRWVSRTWAPFRYEMWSLDDFARFAIFLTRVSETAYSFQDDANIIGGPLDMIMIQPDKSVWLSKHNPATCFEVDLLDTKVPESKTPSQAMMEGSGSSS